MKDKCLTQSLARLNTQDLYGAQRRDSSDSSHNDATDSPLTSPASSFGSTAPSTPETHISPVVEADKEDVFEDALSSQPWEGPQQLGVKQILSAVLADSKIGGATWLNSGVHPLDNFGFEIYSPILKNLQIRVSKDTKATVTFGPIDAAPAEPRPISLNFQSKIQQMGSGVALAFANMASALFGALNITWEDDATELLPPQPLELSAPVPETGAGLVHGCEHATEFLPPQPSELSLPAPKMDTELVRVHGGDLKFSRPIYTGVAGWLSKVVEISIDQVRLFDDGSVGLVGGLRFFSLFTIPNVLHLFDEWMPVFNLDQNSLSAEGLFKLDPTYPEPTLAQRQAQSLALSGMLETAAKIIPPFTFEPSASTADKAELEATLSILGTDVDIRLSKGTFVWDAQLNLTDSKRPKLSARAAAEVVLTGPPGKEVKISLATQSDVEPNLLGKGLLPVRDAQYELLAVGARRPDEEVFSPWLSSAKVAHTITAEKRTVTIEGWLADPEEGQQRTLAIMTDLGLPLPKQRTMMGIDIDEVLGSKLEIYLKPKDKRDA